MKRIRILALLLAMALCLTACGGASSSSGTIAGGDTSDDSQVTVPAEAMEDVVAYLTDGAYTKDSVIATAGDVPVTAAQVLYWTAYQQYQMVYYYYNYYGYTFNMSDDMGDGTTVGQSLLQLGLDTAAAYAVAHQKAVDMNATLDAEVADQLATLYQDNVTAYGTDRWTNYVKAGLINEADFDEEEKAAWIQAHGEEFYKHSLMYYSSTTDAYAALINDYYYYATLQEKLFSEGGEYEPTEAVMEQYIADYISDNGLVWGRCILFSTQDCADDAAVAEVKAQADAAYAELTGLTGEELSAKFTELQTAHDKSGYTPGEVQYYSNTDSLVDGYYEGLVALEPGQIGMTDKTTYGYFILLRSEDQIDSIRSSLESDYVAVTYDALINQWTQEYGVECAMPDLDLTSFYAKLAELQEILLAVDTIEMPEEETSGTSSTGSVAE